MEDKKKVDSILDSIRAEVAEFVAQESTITSSSEYEKKVLALSRKFAKELIAQSKGKEPKSRNLKKK